MTHRRNRMFVRILAIHRGVVSGKHHSVPGERMLDVAGMASPVGRGWCCSHRRWLFNIKAVCSLYICLWGHSHTCSGTAGIAPIPDTALCKARARAGEQPRYPSSFGCHHPCCCGVYSISRILFKIILLLSQ